LTVAEIAGLASARVWAFVGGVTSGVDGGVSDEKTWGNP
jgi:hypothetical protein